MALIKCHECGTEVSMEAKTCPKCGAKVKQPMGGGMIMAIAIGTFLGAFALLGDGGKTTEDTPYAPSASDAAAACRTAIKIVLNDPDSAQFDPPAGASQNSDGTWTARRTLRAKNAFGAYRRAVYECKLMPNGDGTWRGLDVRQITP